MRRLLVVAFVALVLAMAAQAEASVKTDAPDARLDMIASAVALKPIHVYCEDDPAAWDAFEQAWASPLLGYTWLENPVIYVNAQICADAKTLLNANAPLTPATLDPWRAAVAIHVVLHESLHQLLRSRDEALVDCVATKLTPDMATRYFGIPATIIESHTRWSRRPVYGYRYVKRRGHQVRVRMLVAFVKMSHTFQTTSPNEYFTNVASYNIMFHNGLPANYLGGTC
jgi:hypothetical protein